MVPDATSAKEDRRSIADDDDDDDEWEVVQEIRLKRIRAKMRGGGSREGKEEEEGWLIRTTMIGAKERK